jgi:hypothetical protein
VSLVGDTLELLCARHEDVRDCEDRIKRETWRMAALPHLLRPDGTRDVEHHTAPVTLSVDVAGAMQHLVKRDESVLDYLVIGLTVFADRRVERARVAVLDGLGSPPRPVGLRGGEVPGGVVAQ